MTPCACLRLTEDEPSSPILAGMRDVETAVDRTIKANKRFKESLAGTVEAKQEAVAQAMLKVGPPAWRIRGKFCRVLPCESCEEHCVQAEDAVHDIVNVKTGKPIFNPSNLAGFKRVLSSIPVPGEAEAINTKTATANAETKMAFRLAGKRNELIRLYAAGSIAGGAGFALVDHFAVQRLTTLNPNAKDGIHAGLGVVLTLLGAGMNRLWLAELGASYAAVPVARLTERNLLGGIPVGEIGVGQITPGTFPSGVIQDGRTGAVPTTVAGVKTF